MAQTIEIPAKDVKESHTTDWKEGLSMVKCLRCGGLMVAELSNDFWDDAENLVVRRCVQCGELVDPVILGNRQRQLMAAAGASQTGSVLPQSEEMR